MSNEEIKQEAEKLRLKILELGAFVALNDSEFLEMYLTSFAARARNEAIELCAVKCDSRASALTNLTDKLEAEKCASAIRSLKSQEATDGK